MRPEIAAKIDALPALPGVYLMKDANGEVFYIGKAKSLRDRVRSYFSGSDTRAFVAALDSMLADLEVILTSSEKEALLVEDDLVKRAKPRFNVNLKDDKRYLCLRLDTRQAYPRLEVVRRFAKDGARYFGPYPSAHAVRETVRLVNRFFQLRTCSDATLQNRARPCLQYQIKRCPGPCVFQLRNEYAENVEAVVAFLSGRQSELISRLRERMQRQAIELNFEGAAKLRDQIRAVERSLERQRLVTSDFASRDVVGIYREGPAVEIHVMRMREGRLIEAERYSFDELEIETGEILADFATSFYRAGGDIPNEILFPPEMEWTSALAELLRELTGRAIDVLAPQRGDKRHLVELAARNAAQAFRDKQRERGAAKSAVLRLQRALHLSKPPETVECFDISHLQGQSIVASVVRVEGGVPRKERYRHYKIRSTVGQDDFKSIYEVVSRRVRRGVLEGDLPDLLLIDGGKGQLNAARAALEDHGVSGLEVAALAKARNDEATEEQVGDLAAQAELTSDHSPGKPERVFVLGQKNAIVLGQNSAELFLLTRARDEAHRFAISFHRKLHRRAVASSVLDGIPGIGPKRKKLLLRTFGSVERIRHAPAEEIARVIGTKAAAELRSRLGINKESCPQSLVASDLRDPRDGPKATGKE